MNRRRMLIVVPSCVVLACAAVPSTQDTAQQLKLETLLQQLQDYRTTASAGGALLKLGKSDAAARKFLVSHMPDLIRKKKPAMTIEMYVWDNEVQIAGKLRMVEAIPALAEGIEWYSSTVTTGPGDTMTFGTRAAVAALIRIAPLHSGGD